MIHLLFDKHYEEQAKPADLIAERVQTLGGIAIAMGADVAETTQTPRPPRGRERMYDQIARLIRAHDVLLKAAREEADAAEKRDDLATNDLLVSNVLRTNELQVWFLSQHIQ
jgi:starvation-inducible DNA-binding protein